MYEGSNTLVRSVVKSWWECGNGVVEWKKKGSHARVLWIRENIYGRDWHQNWKSSDSWPQLLHNEMEDFAYKIKPGLVCLTVCDLYAWLCVICMLDWVWFVCLIVYNLYAVLCGDLYVILLGFCMKFLYGVMPQNTHKQIYYLLLNESKKPGGRFKAVYWAGLGRAISWSRASAEEKSPSR